MNNRALSAAREFSDSHKQSINGMMFQEIDKKTGHLSTTILTSSGATQHFTGSLYIFGYIDSYQICTQRLAGTGNICSTDYLRDKPIFTSLTYLYKYTWGIEQEAPLSTITHVDGDAWCTVYGGVGWRFLSWGILGGDCDSKVGEIRTTPFNPSPAMLLLLAALLFGVGYFIASAHQRKTSAAEAPSATGT
jgi:hypothetical protein